MAVKPGSERNGLVWTGYTWVRKPKSRLLQINLNKKIAEALDKGIGTKSNSERAERSWKSRSAKSGTVSSGAAVGKRKGPDPRGLNPSATSDKKATSSTVSSAINSAKPKPPPPTPETKNPPRGGGSSSSSPSRGSSTSKAPAKKAPTVSQSRTQWVKKGDVVGGKTVTKGYVAQYGKPEKKVTANVKLVTDTTRGKAGQKVSYTKGRATKKGK
jgi:hypothetical protein